MSDSSKGLSSAGQYRVNKGTSFTQATTVAPKNQNGSTYEASIPLDWCFGPVAHGGYLSSLLSRAVSQHLESLSSSNSSSKQVPTILNTTNVMYLAPVLPGPAEIRIEQRSLNRNSAHFVASLYQSSNVGLPRSKHDPNAPFSLRTEATVSFTSPVILTKTTLSRPMNPHIRIPKSDMFARLVSGQHIPNHDSDMAFYKYKPGWECYFDARHADRAKMLNPHPQHGPAVFDVWWKLDHAISIHEIGFLADLTGPVLFNYEDVRRTHWLSTRQQNAEVIRLPQGGKDAGWEWLFCRMELIENAGDRFYCDVTIADEEGNVVGIARQSCVVMPFEMVGKGKGKDKKTEGSKQEKAKI